MGACIAHLACARTQWRKQGRGKGQTCRSEPLVASVALDQDWESRLKNLLRVGLEKLIVWEAEGSGPGREELGSSCCRSGLTWSNVSHALLTLFTCPVPWSFDYCLGHFQPESGLRSIFAGSSSLSGPSLFCAFFGRPDSPAAPVQKLGALVSSSINLCRAISASLAFLVLLGSNGPRVQPGLHPQFPSHPLLNFQEEDI